MEISFGPGSYNFNVKDPKFEKPRDIDKFIDAKKEMDKVQREINDIFRHDQTVADHAPEPNKVVISRNISEVPYNGATVTGYVNKTGNETDSKYKIWSGSKNKEVFYEKKGDQQSIKIDNYADQVTKKILFDASSGSMTFEQVKHKPAGQ